MYDPSIYQPAVTPVIGRYLPYLNPPLLAWLIAPLTFVPYAIAASIWTGILAACTALIWYLAAPGRHLARVAELMLAIALLPVFIGFRFGQVSLVVVAAVAISWWLIRQDRLLLAGVALSLLALKPQVAFLVPLALLVAGYWRTFFAWLLATMALAALSLFAIGTHGLRGIQESVSLTHGLTGPIQVSLLRNMPSPALTAVMAILAGCVFLFIAYRSRATGPEVPIAVGLLATMLITPYVNFYDLSGLVLAAWLVMRTHPPAWQRAVMLAGYLPVCLAPLSAIPALAFECGWLMWWSSWCRAA